MRSRIGSTPVPMITENHDGAKLRIREGVFIFVRSASDGVGLQNSQMWVGGGGGAMSGRSFSEWLWRLAAAVEVGDTEWVDGEAPVTTWSSSG